MARTNIAVEQSVADELGIEATKANKTQYALANESLLAVIEILKQGGNSKQFYHAWKFAAMMKEIDCVPLPGEMLEKMIKRMHQTDKDWLLKTWFEEGSRLGEYLKMSALTPEELRSAVDEFQLLLPVHKVEFRKIGEISSNNKPGSELSDSRAQDHFVIRAVGVGQSMESTSCAEQFLRGVLSSYSLKILDMRVSQGIIEAKIKGNV
jgi:hypothetical protein